MQFSKVGRSVKGGGRTAIGFRKETCFVKSNSFPSRNFILLFFSTNTLYEFASNLREIFSFHPRDETISKKFQPAFFPSSRDEIFARKSAGEERIADFCREIPPRFLRKKNRGCVRGQCGSTALIIMGKVPRKENVHLCRLFSCYKLHPRVLFFFFSLFLLSPTPPPFRRNKHIPQLFLTPLLINIFRAAYHHRLLANCEHIFPARNQRGALSNRPFFSLLFD